MRHKQLLVKFIATGYRARKIIGAMFLEKLTFDGANYRTPRINEAVRLICSLDEAFGEIKKGHSSNITEMSFKVTPLGLEPRTY